MKNPTILWWLWVSLDTMILDLEVRDTSVQKYGKIKFFLVLMGNIYHTNILSQFVTKK